MDLDMDQDPIAHQTGRYGRIQIRIKVTSRIRIRVRIKMSGSETHADTKLMKQLSGP